MRTKWCRTLILAVLAAYALVISTIAGPSAQTQSRPTLRVLFIGNSLIYYNNLGDILAGIAASDAGGPTIVPTLAVRGATRLNWHLENGLAVKELQRGGWDYVVLQEHSLLGAPYTDGKTIVADPAQFHASVREWVKRIRDVGATPILYMTFARREGAGEMARVQRELTNAYNSIGRELGVKVAPVGLAFAEAQRRLRTLDLHIWDAVHPTPAGSYLAGAVIYSTITGRSPVGAPSVIEGRPAPTMPDGSIVVDRSLQVPLVDIREATAAELQDVAWTVVLGNSGPTPISASAR